MKLFYDDGFNDFLVKGASFISKKKFPLLPLNSDVETPKTLIPFTKLRTSKNKRGFIHFYIHDKYFKCFMEHPEKYLELLKQYDGVISIDLTMYIGNTPCLLETSTYMNRAISYFLIRNGVPLIHNIRRTNKDSFKFCFLGIPRHSTVCISTHGCIKSKEQRSLFKLGLKKLIKALEPIKILVYGKMPDAIFAEFKNKVTFIRYPSEFELTHENKGKN